MELKMKREILSKLIEISRNPYPYLKEWKKEKGKKILGSTLADVPEEIIYASGAHPFLILGTTKPLRLATTRLPDNACSLSRSNLELVLTYEGELFDGYVLPQVCDTTQHLCDIWKRKFSDRYFENFLVPRQVNRPSAGYWYIQESERLIWSLERYLGIKIKEDALWEAIDIYNENRRLLRSLYDIKRKHPGMLTNREFFDIVKSGFFMDKKEHNMLLKELIDSIDIEKDKKEDDYVPIVVAGIVVEPNEIFDFMDNGKINVVSDDLCTGSRYIEVETKKEGTPIEAIADAYLKKGPFSPIHDEGNKMFYNLKNRVEKYGAKGIIYVHIKYCESQDYDFPDLRRNLKAQGIKVLEVETEYQTTHMGQTKTRIQAFVEALSEEARNE